MGSPERRLLPPSVALPEPVRAPEATSEAARCAILPQPACIGHVIMPEVHKLVHGRDSLMEQLAREFDQLL